MRINEVITNDIDQRLMPYVKKILAHCKPYLQAISYDPIQFPLWRGIQSPTTKEFLVLQCPVNRQPMDTQQYVHGVADNYFEKNFGVAYRSNAFFATGSEAVAADYGSEAGGSNILLFPIDNFSYVWSEHYHDLYHTFNDRFPWRDEMRSNPVMYRNAIVAFLDDGMYVNHSIKRAIHIGCEIMVHCGAAYGINQSALEGEEYRVLELIKQNGTA